MVFTETQFYLNLRIKRNVNSEHLTEVFGIYGKVVKAELQTDRRSGMSKGTASVEYEKASEAEQAVLFLNGGQMDGKVLRVDFILVDSRNRDQGRRESRSRDRGISDRVRPGATRERDAHAPPQWGGDRDRNRDDARRVDRGPGDRFERDRDRGRGGVGGGSGGGGGGFAGRYGPADSGRGRPGDRGPFRENDR